MITIYTKLLVIVVIGTAISLLLILTNRYKLGGTILICSMLVRLADILVKIITFKTITSNDVVSILLCAAGFVCSCGFMQEG